MYNWNIKKIEVERGLFLEDSCINFCDTYIGSVEPVGRDLFGNKVWSVSLFNRVTNEELVCKCVLSAENGRKIIESTIYMEEVKRRVQI